MKGFWFIAPLVFFLLAACGEKKEPAPPAAPPADSAPAPVAPEAPKAEAPKPAPANSAGPTIPGTTTRSTELKDKPFVDAKTLRTLPANTAVAVLERQSGWMRVKVAGQEGWVRMLNVRTGTGATPAGADAKTITTLATGRAGTGNIVATSGIRGLNEEQLRTAKGDREQLKKMEGYGASKQDATQYAAKHGLKATELSYLPAPGEK